MSNYEPPDGEQIQNLKDIANKLRIHSIESTNASNSGHPTSCCSAAEVMSVLFFHTMRYTVEEPRAPNNDRFVLSKGHAAPILYAAWAEVGLFLTSRLLDLRKLSSDLEGHPTPRLSFIDVATGSLGQGLSCAAGMAYTGKYFDQGDYRVYCLVGDGESAEGAIWEALAFSSHYKLDNLVAIMDVNRLGQTEATSLGHDMEVYNARLQAFGWNTYVVDGHEVEALCKAFHDATKVKGKPTCILAKTFKGYGVPGICDQENWHGKPLGAMSDHALKTLRENIAHAGPHNMIPPAPSSLLMPLDLSVQLATPPDYKLGENVTTRRAYGSALVKIGTNNNRVVALDGDTKDSTFAEKFWEAFPDRFIECFIAEQNLVGTAIGCATRDRAIVFVSTFAVFFTRAFDQIRMGAISRTNVNFVGSHAGLSIGEDGPTEMALEDLAMFRSIPGSTVFYPSDAVSTERAVELAAQTKGVCFIRTTRPNVPVIYHNEEPFNIGKAKIVRHSDNDKVTIIGSCVTLVEAMKAAVTMSTRGINVRILDPFTIKPIDDTTIIASANQTGGNIITVEDHYAEGGIGEAVASAVSGHRDIVVKRLFVPEIPRSGRSDELLDKYGISAACIVKAVESMLTSS